MTDETSDELLWASVRRGDTAAFGVIFDRHLNSVHLQCARRTGSFQDAEDLASATFLEAWRLRERVRFVDGSVKPWLLVVATNLARRSMRSQQRFQSLLGRVLSTSEVTPDFADDVSAKLDADARAGWLVVAMAALSTNDQKIISLCDLAELSYAEVAAVLDVPLGTVRSRLLRARERLRRQLHELRESSLSTQQQAQRALEEPTW